MSFEKRMEEFKNHCEKMLKELIQKGLKKEEVKIFFEPLKKKSLKATFHSKSIFKIFCKLRNNDEEIKKIEKILNPKTFKIMEAENSIIISEERGLSLFSQILQLTVIEIGKQLKIRRERIKKLYLKIKEILKENGGEKIFVKIKKELGSKKMVVEIRFKTTNFSNKETLLHIFYEKENQEEIIKDIELLVQCLKK